MTTNIISAFGLIVVVTLGAKAGQPLPPTSKPAVANAPNELPNVLPRVPADGVAPQDQVSQARLLATLQSLPTKRSANGTDEHRKGLHDTEELMLDSLRALGFAPMTHEFDFLGSSRDGRRPAPSLKPDTPNYAPDAAPVAAERLPWRNIIVEIKGQTRPEEVLIFSAHIDAVPESPGADDDGTGVAAILEMARLLKDRPMQRTVRLCLFNLEEVGLVGSRAYVESIEEEILGKIITPASPDSGRKAERASPTMKFVGMASIDGVGYFTDEPNSQKSPIPETKFFKPPTVGDFLAMGGIARHRMFSQALDKAMRQAAPELKTVVVDFLPIALPDLLRSDHAPFLGLGVPAVILADTANFRNPHYHQPTDTIETLDMKRFTDVVRGLVGAAHTLAGPVGQPLTELVPKRPDAPAPPVLPESRTTPQPLKRE